MDIVGDKTIGGLSKVRLEEYRKIFNDNKLHWMNNQMAEVFYEAVQRIYHVYKGNAALIWEDRPTGKQVVERFLEFHGVGQKIANMAAGILARDFHIPMSDYSNIDVAFDVHISRVMGRMGLVENPDSQIEIVEKARKMNPQYPGIIDEPLWTIGRIYCHAEAPECDECPVQEACKYYYGDVDSIKAEDDDEFISETKYQHFPPEVIEELKYYVYRLVDPRTGLTFYVGKGTGNRVFAHIEEALSGNQPKSITESNEDEVTEKIQQIRDINAAGLDLISIIHRRGLSEKEALEVEAALIDCYPGLTNLQKGYGAERGATNTKELLKELTRKEYKEPQGIDYCIIKITDTSISERGSIYEAVRKYWKVNLNRINKVPYVLAVKNDIVIEVFEAERWKKAEEAPGRAMFIGHVARNEIRDLFIDRKIPMKYRKKGMASPVLYNDNYDYY